jgi:mRNA-degrading endonuclease RelE of RelBE toxin-antitoxin system
VIRCKWTDCFLKAVGKLDRKYREHAYEAVDKFQLNPRLPGLNFEKLKGNSGMHSIRIASGHRILLSKQIDDRGEFWRLEDIGAHDIYNRL